MVYLALYPLAAAATLAVAVAWQMGIDATGLTRNVEHLAWVFVVAFTVVVARQGGGCAAAKPVIFQDAYLAGQWARAHVPAGCVDYLVADGDTPHWLHLAVLGNRRMTARTADDDTFDPKKAIVRWIIRAGFRSRLPRMYPLCPETSGAARRFSRNSAGRRSSKRTGESWCSEDRPPGEDWKGWSARLRL